MHRVAANFYMQQLEIATTKNYKLANSELLTDINPEAAGLMDRLGIAERVE